MTIDLDRGINQRPAHESDEQARDQVLSCLEDVKLDLGELKQHSSAAVVEQAIELIQSLVSEIERLTKLVNDTHSDLLMRAKIKNSDNAVIELSSTLWHRLCDAIEPSAERSKRTEGKP